MKWTTIAGAVAAAALLSGVALAQQPSPKASDCQAKAPQKVDGQVTTVDPKTNKITVKDKGGSTHEFQTTKETLQTMKPGDKIEATLRQAPQC
jgi:Cu/Ag efflux protein CusF